MTPGSRTGADKDSGRTCPYCRFPLKSGVSIVDCEACGAAHHAECWADNGGCAVTGCAGGPLAVAAGVPPGAAPPAAPPPPPPADQPPARGSRSPSALVAAILVLAIVMAGSALAIVLTSADPQPPPTTPALDLTTPPTTATVVVTAPPPTVTEPGDTPPPSSPETTTPRQLRVAAIRQVVERYFAAIREGDYDTAWGLLSRKYRSWKRRSGGGRAKWERQEANVRAHVTGTLSLSETGYDGASRVSTILVSGLRFQEADGSQCAYEGITWARQEDDDWRYDQGYLHDDARRARWRPQRGRTLGFLCDDSGY